MRASSQCFKSGDDRKGARCCFGIEIGLGRILDRMREMVDDGFAGRDRRVCVAICEV